MAAIFPSLATWLESIPLPSSMHGIYLCIYAAEKVIQLVLPLAWVAFCSRGSLGWPKRVWSGVGFGVLFGAVVAIATLLLYALVLRKSDALLTGVGPILAKAHGLGINTPIQFIVWAVLISLANSAMEEYYWRWSLFGPDEVVCPDLGGDCPFQPLPLRRTTLSCWEPFSVGLRGRWCSFRPA